MGNNSDLGENYENWSSKQLLWATWNKNSQNKPVHILYFEYYFTVKYCLLVSFADENGL